MKRGTTQLKRSPVKPKRSTPRRREAPRWDRSEWEHANRVITARSGGRCEICGKTGRVERHHRKRRRDGGDRLSNVVFACGPGGCHQHLTEHPAEARKMGWIVSLSREPDEIPFLRFRTEWVFLDDVGGVRTAYGVEDAHDVGG